MAISTFNQQITTPYPPDAVERDWSARFTGWLASQGFMLSAQAPGSLTYTNRHTPGIAVFFAIILFPIGLFALLAKREHHLIVTFQPYGEGTYVTVTGTMFHGPAAALTSELQSIHTPVEHAPLAPSVPPPPPPPPMSVPGSTS